MRTLNRWFSIFWNNIPFPIIPDNLDNEILVIDAVSVSPRKVVALIGRTKKHVVNWTFAKSESSTSWSTFLNPIPKPFAIVCDGQKGMLSAIRGRFPNSKIQRCVVHIARQVRIKLTRHPKTEAGKEIKVLIRSLMFVRTKRQKRRWIRRWRKWCHKHHKFLSEKSYGENQFGKTKWWYTHKKLRSVRTLIKNSLPDLFTYVRYPYVPRTTNHVEGGINSRIKELFRRHRGLSIHRKVTLISWFLSSKQGQKPPRNVH